MCGISSCLSINFVLLCFFWDHRISWFHSEKMWEWLATAAGWTWSWEFCLNVCLCVYKKDIPDYRETKIRHAIGINYWKNVAAIPLGHCFEIFGQFALIRFYAFYDWFDNIVCGIFLTIAAGKLKYFVCATMTALMEESIKV